MIVRTPPPKKPRVDTRAIDGPNPDRPLVIYEDPPVPETSHDATEQMLCTYQCRQMVKTEFFDALGKAEKQALDFQSKVEESNGKFCKSESERKKFRDKYLYAEQELAAANARENALQEQLLKEVNDNKDRLKKQIQSHNELEVKLQNEMNLRKNAESAAALSEEKAVGLERKEGHESEVFEREKRHLCNELEQLRKDSELSQSRISLDLEKMKCVANNAEKESKLLKEQLDELKMQLYESLNQKAEIEKKLSWFTSQEIPSTEANILVKHLQDELRNYESEVQEARKLKSVHDKVELLKEKLLEEKFRRESAESELRALPQLQQRVNDLEEELASWNRIIRNIPEASCSEDIIIKFAASQKEVLDSMMKVGEATAQLKQMEMALDSAETCKQNAEAEFALVKEQAEASKLEAMQFEKMFSSVMDERDHLQHTVNELRKQKSIGGNGVDSSTLVQELELSLVKKESCIKELHNYLHDQSEVNDRQRDEIMLLTEKLNDGARRMKSLERDGDRLRSEVYLLESKLGHGDFSTANTKVLRMVNTLAVDNETRQTIEALQTELQKTKEKLLAVQELKSLSGDAEIVDLNVSGKIVQLKEQIATLEKREERYKTVFADRISVFRRACCEIFGYKIVMDDQRRPDGISVTRFTLQSIYAESDDEKLELEYESGNTKILANEYTRRPDIFQQVDIFVQKMNSIPAFTANLTVEAFNRRTLS